MDTHSTPASRRIFLRGLAALPLIGGAVNIVGKPIAADIIPTDALHERYLGWLSHEHQAAVREHAYRSALAAQRGEAEAVAASWRASYLSWTPFVPDIEALVASDRPSSRAAVILSAAGVPLA